MTASSIGITRSTALLREIAIDASRDRDRREGDLSRSRLREIALSIAIGDAVVELELAKHCAVESSQSLMIFFFWVLSMFF